MPIPNDGMVEEAERGLAWRREFGRGGTEVGIARARDIANRRNLSMDTVRRMNSYFARHEVDKEGEGFYPDQDGYPSNGRIAWALWSGDAGWSWAKRILEQEDDERSSFSLFVSDLRTQLASSSDAAIRSFLSDYIVTFNLMASRAGSKSFGDSIFIHAASEVLGRQDWFEVRGIDARSVATQVVDMMSDWDWANNLLVTEAMCWRSNLTASNAADGEISISTRGLCSSPIPAVILASTFINLCPEAFRSGEFSHNCSLLSNLPTHITSKRGSKETRPYEGEHAARIRDPRDFDSFRRRNNEGGQGVDFVYGVKDGTADIQSIRFKVDFFTEEQAREWLERNDFEPLLFEPAVPVDDERSIVLSSTQISETMMDKRAEPDELSVGDYVTWDSSGGEVYGQIERIERDGEIDVPDSDFTITGTEDDPAALIMVYREVEDGWSPSGTRVGHKFSTLTKVSARYYDEDGKKKRHIKRIEETDDEIIVVFAKDDHEDDMEEMSKQDREMRPTKKIEVRAEHDGGVRVTGYAAVFGEETNIGGMFTEVIEKGAFRSALDRGDDVVFLINHDGLPLARTRSGTLKLREDERGLFVDTYLDPNDPDVRSIIPKMRRGDLDKMSFAFIPTRQEWDDSGDMPKRSIQDLQLYDVSIVTTPAYDGTEIGLRSLQQYREEQKKSQAARRLRMKSRLA